MRRLLYFHWKVVGMIAHYLNKWNGTECDNCGYNGIHHGKAGCLGGLHRWSSCAGWLNKGFKRHKAT